MVKQQRRTNRGCLPAAGTSVSRVRFPVCPVQRRRPRPPAGFGQEAGGAGDGKRRRRAALRRRPPRKREEAGGGRRFGWSGAEESEAGRLQTRGGRSTGQWREAAGVM
ncbi:uncharacterized protein LOC144539633 [Centroberyx gerrardi]